VDAYGTARLAAKDAESAIVARVCGDFNLRPVLMEGALRADGPLRSKRPNRALYLMPAEQRLAQARAPPPGREAQKGGRVSAVTEAIACSTACFRGDDFLTCFHLAPAD
jgi:hypothetical protein